MRNVLFIIHCHTICQDVDFYPLANSKSEQQFPMIYFFFLHCDFGQLLENVNNSKKHVKTWCMYLWMWIYMCVSMYVLIGEVIYWYTLLIILVHLFSFILWGVNSKVDLLAKRVRCLLAHCQQGYFFKALVYFFLAFCYFGDFFFAFVS